MKENEIKIGDQTWTSKNLNVTTYRNGDVIPQMKYAIEWESLTTGAWCYYENESDNGTTYGKHINRLEWNCRCYYRRCFVGLGN